MGSDNEGKRQVPPALRALLNLDVAVTNKVCSIADTIPQITRSNLKHLEISCHGIPWIALWLAFILLSGNPSFYQVQVNFLVGLVLDIVAVSVIKAIVRRRRPVANETDMFLVVGPDNYSFPSGHASRAAFVAHFFATFLDLPGIVQFNLFLWSATVCISTVLLRRHHVLDVAAGAALGFFECLFVGFIWFGQETCEWLLLSFSS